MIEHIFFDLDHTLWDFDRNSEHCLVLIHERHLSEKIGFEAFFESFKIINRALWRDLEDGKITHQELRKKRFKTVLESNGISCDIDYSLVLNEEFLKLLPSQTHLFPNTIKTLEYLFAKYKLHIISNGFYEVQLQKIANSGINNYFQEIITGDVANSRKPDKKIFEFALSKANATTDNSIYIGDDEIADKIGAQNANLPFIHFNPNTKESSNTEIAELKFLMGVL